MEFYVELEDCDGVGEVACVDAGVATLIERELVEGEVGMGLAKVVVELRDVNAATLVYEAIEFNERSLSGVEGCGFLVVVQRVGASLTDDDGGSFVGLWKADGSLERRAMEGVDFVLRGAGSEFGEESSDVTELDGLVAHEREAFLNERNFGVDLGWCELGDVGSEELVGVGFIGGLRKFFVDGVEFLELVVNAARGFDLGFWHEGEGFGLLY